MPDLEDREWRIVHEESRGGPMNMALDEIAAETAAGGGPRTVRVYRWEPSTLSLGYHQDPETVDWEFCEQEGITVTRRPTGGGAIYHDLYGDISYSVVAPAEELPGDLMESYELLCEPVLDAFEGMGVEAGYASEERPAVHQPACYLREMHPAHDVVAPDGRKLSGNAQYRRRDAVVQHGSLTYEALPERHLGTFTAEVPPLAFEERVTSIREQAGCAREEAVRVLEETLADWADNEASAWTDDEASAWTDDELTRARERAKEKYGSEAWTRHREEP